MEQFFKEFGYLALMIGTFFEGETAILTASSLIHRGVFDFHWTVLAAFFGSFVSDWIYYLIGHFNGKVFLTNRPKLLARVEPVSKFFHTHKLQILFSYRFLYGFRIIIPLVIGMSGLTPITYLFYTIVTGLIWATTISTAGYWAGRILDLEAKAFEQNFWLVMVCCAAVGLTIGFVIKKIAMRNVEAEDSTQK